jgi:hypothetical protein
MPGDVEPNDGEPNVTSRGIEMGDPRHFYLRQLLQYDVYSRNMLVHPPPVIFYCVCLKSPDVVVMIRMESKTIWRFR